MKATLLTLIALIVPLSLALRAANVGEETRYNDVVYLDEAKAKPFPLKTIRRVDFTDTRDASTVLAKLAKGATVWVFGFGPGRDYVEATTPKGKARGWVDEDALEPASEEVRSGIETRVLTAHRQKALIARHAIEIGMTRNQVQASLGKPDESTRTEDGEQVDEQWIYRTFQTAPQKDTYTVDGATYERVHYKKVQTSGKTVTLRNDQVVEIKEESKLPGASGSSITQGY
ncbi:MAG: hypothetical protein EXS18_05520 [Verrucomicrobiae bacterium]|nr:hypothetical protein [Verrucomicrobiae bacterium]